MPRKARLKAPPPLEVQTHIAVADALRVGAVRGWLWTHFPAGGFRSLRTGALLKRMGLKRGWADFLLIDPQGQHLWLELKRGVLTDLTVDQVAFTQALDRRGVTWAVARSTDEAIRVLTDWGALRLTVSA